MALENEDGQEKTEEPTARKLEQAAANGQRLTSKEMMVFATVSTGVLVLITISPFFGHALEIWGRMFVMEGALNFESAGIAKVRSGFLLVVFITIIIGTPMMIVSLLTQTAVGGFGFAPKAMSFKGKKLNPITGLKNIVSVKSLVELGKAILKVVLLFSVGAAIIYTQLPELLYVSASSLGSGLIKSASTFPKIAGGMLVVLFFIAVIDYFWQRHSFNQQMRMTFQEVKDESKQTEGSPEVKRKIRRMQFEKSREAALQRDALENVATATAIITNPTHFAVALKYTAGQAGAPEVVAMGRGPLAQQIIDRAKDARITTLRIPILARALYFTSEIGGEIAEGLYNAVAVILAYVFRIDSGESMDMPELTLPPELRFDENGNLEQGV